MKKADTYRAARRNFTRGVVWVTATKKGFPWGDSAAIRANQIAKLDERRATCHAAREFVAKALVEKDSRYKGVRTNAIVAKALRDFWTNIAGVLKGTTCSVRMRGRMLKQIDELDLRLTRA